MRCLQTAGCPFDDASPYHDDVDAVGLESLVRRGRKTPGTAKEQNGRRDREGERDDRQRGVSFTSGEITKNEFGEKHSCLYFGPLSENGRFQAIPKVLPYKLATAAKS